jgi:hypothetical protein
MTPNQPWPTGSRSRLRPSKSELVRDKARAREKSRYKIVAIGLYEDLVQSIDEATHELQLAGYIKANRSLVFQELARRFLQEVDGMTSEQILEHFLRRPIRRPPVRVASRESQSNAVPDKAPARPASRRK